MLELERIVSKKAQLSKKMRPRRIDGYLIPAPSLSPGVEHIDAGRNDCRHRRVVASVRMMASRPGLLSIKRVVTPRARVRTHSRRS
jgi:hypothetical protein